MASPPAVTRLHRDVDVHVAERRVEVRARVACTQGFLEQVACGRGSREHESLLVIEAPASVLHAALLSIGLHPGRPGSWTAAADGGVALVPPEGDPVRLHVRWLQAGMPREEPVGNWIRGLEGEAAWVFAGSRFASVKGGETYLADASGSLVGLVTFGDEVVAMRQVVPDRTSVRPATFRARTDAMPAEGSEATLVLLAAP